MSTSPLSTPVLVISMGVSGCGKSTLAKHLAKKFGLAFLEADDFHSDENKAHMASGKPLTDAMREPWIASMCDNLRDHRERGESCVLAYSGLRRAHRARRDQSRFEQRAERDARLVPPALVQRGRAAPGGLQRAAHRAEPAHHGGAGHQALGPSGPASG